MEEQRTLYKKPKYFYTALRFMVDIYRAPKPKCIDYNYRLYKTSKRYVIETYYVTYIRYQRKKKIPINISMPIKSKDLNDLKIETSNEYWRYRAKIQKELKSYYLSLRKIKEPAREPNP